MFLNNDYLRRIEKDTSNSPALDIMYDFAQTYQKYMEEQHDFHCGEMLTSVESHILKHICQNSGITITDIVNYWGRTKGTVSAQIKKLEQKGFVFKEKCKNNPKKIHIFPTVKGIQANEEHIKYDINESTKFMEQWLSKYTFEQMEIFAEQIIFYTKYLKNSIK